MRSFYQCKPLLASPDHAAYALPMMLSIEFRGQLALTTTAAKITREVAAGTSLVSLLQEVAAQESERFRELVFDENGDCGSTLFIAIDGEHVRVDGEATVPEGAREMVIMPPIAGG
ncbi:MAG: molybdopterin converting factor small subunit [Verrucomicrobiales bacterium]|jgi:molybdopterin converting factor small subunit